MQGKAQGHDMGVVLAEFWEETFSGKVLKSISSTFFAGNKGIWD